MRLAPEGQDLAPSRLQGLNKANESAKNREATGDKWKSAVLVSWAGCFVYKPLRCRFPLFQNESSCGTFHINEFVPHESKLQVKHIQLGNGPLKLPAKCSDRVQVDIAFFVLDGCVVLIDSSSHS